MSGGAAAKPGGRWDLSTGGLDEIAEGLTLALDELKDVGMTAEALAGRGFSELELSGMELGDESLANTFQSFCERWEWGVRALINEGNVLAALTGLSAGIYYENEQYIAGAFKFGFNALVGDPHASEEEVTKKGWGEIATQSLHYDYSKESFVQASENVRQGWKDAARDVMTSHIVGPENMLRLAGVSDAEYDKFLDDHLGPSPEERARAEQQGREG